ncbi:MAG: large conductance mechanosensitive channel protein MscL [Clostridiales Family XIII bacterium]|nr:large conductance mechanosensitive channel protein MscL [Clostridiales Family XIII bacterium]
MNAGKHAGKIAEKKGIVQEFKEFALRGNVLDLAVAVVMGAAFNEVVKSLVDGVITPIIGIIAKTESIALLKVTVGSADIKYGEFISTAIHFFLVALAIFIMVKLINSFRTKQKEDDAPAEPTEKELLMEIRDLLKERDTHL